MGRRSRLGGRQPLPWDYSSLLVIRLEYMAWPVTSVGLQEVLGRTRTRSALSYRSRCADAPNARIHERQLLPMSAASSRRYPPFVSPHVGDVAAGRNKSTQLQQRLHAPDAQH